MVRLREWNDFPNQGTGEKVRFIFSVLARLFQTELIQATFKSFLITAVFCPYIHSRIPTTRTLDNSNLSLTRTNFHFPSSNFVYNFIFDNSWGKAGGSEPPASRTLLSYFPYLYLPVPALFSPSRVTVSGFKAQLVRASHRYREVTGSNPVEVPDCSGFCTQLPGISHPQLYTRCMCFIY